MSPVPFGADRNQVIVMSVMLEFRLLLAFGLQEAPSQCDCASSFGLSFEEIRFFISIVKILATRQAKYISTSA